MIADAEVVDEIDGLALEPYAGRYDRIPIYRYFARTVVWSQGDGLRPFPGPDYYYSPNPGLRGFRRAGERPVFVLRRTPTGASTRVVRCSPRGDLISGPWEGEDYTYRLEDGDQILVLPEVVGASWGGKDCPPRWENEGTIGYVDLFQTTGTIPVYEVRSTRDATQHLIPDCGDMQDTVEEWRDDYRVEPALGAAGFSVLPYPPGSTACGSLDRVFGYAFDECDGRCPPSSL